MTRSSARVEAVRIEMGAEERQAVADVLASGRLVQGTQVAAFESEFAQIVDGRHCVAVNSGTSALHLALLAADIGPGDEVIVPSFTFAATANAVVRAGAKPVFVDIDPRSFNVDIRCVEAALTSATRAVVPVHLYGQPADMTDLGRVAAVHGLLVLEDACQAHGALFDERPAGALGDIAAFSFYATKNMTTGEGGMVVCRDEDIARKVRLLRNQGMQEKYRNEIAGLNNRMTDISAAIGRVQLRRLAAWNDERRATAKRYDTELVGVVTPPVSVGARHVYHQYTVRAERRDDLLRALDDQGVDAAVYYPVPTHRLPAYGGGERLPETDRAASEVLSLPIRPGLAPEEITRVIESVNDIVGSL